MMSTKNQTRHYTRSHKSRARRCNGFPKWPRARLRTDQGRGRPDRLYTLLHDEGYSSLATVFNPEFRRLPAEDTLTVARDVIGSYPYAFYRVEQGALDFATQVSPLIRRECDAVDALLW